MRVSFQNFETMTYFSVLWDGFPQRNYAIFLIKKRKKKKKFVTLGKLHFLKLILRNCSFCTTALPQVGSKMAPIQINVFSQLTDVSPIFVKYDIFGTKLRLISYLSCKLLTFDLHFSTHRSQHHQWHLYHQCASCSASSREHVLTELSNEFVTWKINWKVCQPHQPASLKQEEGVEWQKLLRSGTRV